MGRLDIFYLIIFLKFGIYSTQEQRYSLGSFSEPGGVFFQEMGPVHLYHEVCRIITFIDLKTVLNYSPSFRINCENLYPIHCNSVPLFYETYKKERTLVLNMLGLNVGEDLNLNFVNTVFGKFDSQDTIFYSQHTITSSNSSIRFRSIDNETILINSTFGTSFPEMIQDYNFKNFSGSKDDLKLTEFYERFDEWKLEMRTLTTAVLFSRLGKIHPEILPPNDLIDALKKINQTLHGTTFPFKLEIHNYDEIMSISDLRVIVANGKLIFDLLVPVLKEEDYEQSGTLYKIISFPMKLEAENLYFFIEPRAQYVTINSKDLSYFFSHESDFQNCKKTHDFRLCPNKYSTRQINSANTCEDSLMNKSKRDEIFSTCRIKLIKFEQTIWYRIKNNVWVFSTHQDRIVVTCPGKTFDPVSIANSGWLILNSQCVAVSMDTTLLPQTTFNEQIGENLRFPLGKIDVLEYMETYLKGSNISFDQILIPNLGHYSHLDPGFLKNVGISLDEVKIQIDNLKHELLQRKDQNPNEEKFSLVIEDIENLKNKTNLQKEFELFRNEIEAKLLIVDHRVKNLENKTDQQVPEIGDSLNYLEQLKNSNHMRKYQFLMWACISILSLILIIYVLRVSRVFQKLYYVCRKNYTDSIEIENSQSFNSIDVAHRNGDHQTL